jgi:hypothetical protein
VLPWPTFTAATPRGRVSSLYIAPALCEAPSHGVLPPQARSHARSDDRRPTRMPPVARPCSLAIAACLRLRCLNTYSVWHPRFLISIINANDRINWVKPVDVVKPWSTWVLLGEVFSSTWTGTSLEGGPTHLSWSWDYMEVQLQNRTPYGVAPEP